MQTTAVPKLTVAEVELAEKVGLFLLPTLREMVGSIAAKRDTDATAKFCNAFSNLQQAREYLPDSAGPMARVEIELRMLELAAQFVASQSRT